MSSSESISPNRWQPERAGLINVWQYTNEVLRFEKGRMVLFGPNGSGKTMALELLLPYLIDARGQQSRLSASGSDRGGFWSRIAGYDPNEPRTGYLWLEFKRANGEVFTCGLRVRANISGSGDRHWFTTSARVGHDLDLLDKQGHPLGPEQLRQAIGDRGRVYGSDASAYRARVRSVLYPGRSEDQMESMVRTLLTVRKQNFSGHLSPRVLSELLSQALPPLDDNEVAKVADGFADLDRRRDHIAGLEQDLHTIEQLVRSNRAYARAVSSRVVHRLLSATTDFDRVTRRLREAVASFEALKAKASEIDALLEHLEGELRALNGEKTGLEQSEDFREGSRLASLRVDLAEQAKSLSDADKDLERERESLDRCQSSLSSARAEQAQEKRDLNRNRCELQDRVQRLGGPETTKSESDKVASLIQVWVQERRVTIRSLRKRLEKLQRAHDRRSDAQRAKIKANEKLDEAEDRRSQALESKDAAEQQWWEQEKKWRDEALQLSSHYSIAEDPWLAQEAMVLAYSKALEPLIEARTHLAQRSAQLEEQLKETLAELESRRSGQEIAPEAPADRRDRESLEGAPLWKLIDFAEGLSDEQESGLESALLQSQLLDAWVSASGRIELQRGCADVLALHSSRAQQGVSTQACPLKLDLSARFKAPAAFEKFLRSIVWVEQDADQSEHRGLVIASDGSWRNSHLFGRAPIRPARYIGSASREAARLARIAALQAQAADLREELGACGEQSKALQEQLSRCCQEKQSFPSTEALDRALQALRANEDRVNERKAELLDALGYLEQMESELADQLEALEQEASELSLPGQSQELDRYEDDLAKVSQGLQDYSRRWDRLVVARRKVQTEEAREGECKDRVQRSEQRLRVIRLQHREMSAKVQTLESTVGQSYQQLISRIESIRVETQALSQRRQELEKTQRRLAREEGGLEQKCEQSARERQESMKVREQTHLRYLDLLREGLLDDAGVEWEGELAALDTYSARLSSARLLRRQKYMQESPEDAKINRLLTGVHKWQHQATQQLAGRVSLSFEPNARDWSVLRARQDGILKSGGELRAQLAADRQRAREEIDQKQQALFEEILTGSLREHLKERLWSAESLIKRINTILGGVRSAAGGVRVTIGWEINSELPECQSLARAKDLLISDSPISDGRAELDQFLRNRVEQIRADEADTGDWRDRLERMLDYREWHRFEVWVHHNRFGDKPRKLLSRKVSLSTGEKTIVMVLPLIAAVVAHYEPASGESPCESPRLLLMDEIFPNVDFVNKAQLMGLLPKLHLDAVFTSDKDRCEYKTLDGIAIHVFQKFEEDKTTTTRLVWNGRELSLSPEEVEKD